MRIYLTILGVIRAPAEKTALLESRLGRQRFRLKRIIREMEFACLDPLLQKVDPKHQLPGWFDDVGVRGYQNKHYRLGFCPRRKIHILWDNW